MSWDVLELLAQGASNDAIAENLVVTPKTVRNYVSRIYKKLGADRRAQAVVLAREAGLGQGSARRRRGSGGGDRRAP